MSLTTKTIHQLLGDGVIGLWWEEGGGGEGKGWEEGEGRGGGGSEGEEEEVV